MTTYEEIFTMLKEAQRAPVSAERGVDLNLYTDLGFDSLSFIEFLLKIEETYSITFELSEMAQCLQTAQLMALVEQKLKGRGGAAIRRLLMERKTGIELPR